MSRRPPTNAYGIQSKGTTFGTSYGEAKAVTGKSYTDNLYNANGIVTGQNSWGYSQNVIAGAVTVTSAWKMTAGTFDDYGTLTDSTVTSYSGKGHAAVADIASMSFVEGDFTTLTGESTTTNKFNAYGIQSKGTTFGTSYGEAKAVTGKSYTDNLYNANGIVTGQNSWGYSQNVIAGAVTVTSAWKMTAGTFDDYGTLTDSTVTSYSGKGHAAVADIAAMSFVEGDFTTLTGESTTTNKFNAYGIQSKGTTFGTSYGEAKAVTGKSYTDNLYNANGIVTGQNSWGYSQNVIAGAVTVTSAWKMTAGTFDDYGTLTDSTVTSYSGKGHAAVADIAAMSFVEGDFTTLTGESTTTNKFNAYGIQSKGTTFGTSYGEAKAVTGKSYTDNLYNANGIVTGQNSWGYSQNVIAGAVTVTSAWKMTAGTFDDYGTLTDSTVTSYSGKGHAAVADIASMSFVEGDFTTLTGESTTTNKFNAYGIQSKGTTFGTSEQGQAVTGKSYTDNLYNANGIVTTKNSWGYSQNVIAGAVTVTSAWKMTAGTFDDYGTLTDSTVTSYSGKGHAAVADIAAMSFVEGDFTTLTGESTTTNKFNAYGIQSKGTTFGTSYGEAKAVTGKSYTDNLYNANGIVTGQNSWGYSQNVIAGAVTVTSAWKIAAGTFDDYGTLTDSTVTSYSGKGHAAVADIASMSFVEGDFTTLTGESTTTNKFNAYGIQSKGTTFGTSYGEAKAVTGKSYTDNLYNANGIVTGQNSWGYSQNVIAGAVTVTSAWKMTAGITTFASTMRPKRNPRSGRCPKPRRERGVRRIREPRVASPRRRAKPRRRRGAGAAGWGFPRNGVFEVLRGTEDPANRLGVRHSRGNGEVAAFQHPRANQEGTGVR